MYESLPGVTCPETNILAIFMLSQSFARSKKSVLLHATVTATKPLRGMFISGHVTLGNDPCNLCHNGATKLRDRLQEKLPSVTAPYRVQAYIFISIDKYMI